MMENAISEYQRWKQQGENLRSQAKQAMESRFRDLLTEAARISQEYHADFGATLKPPPQITAFRFKASTGKGSKAAGTAKKAGKPGAAPAAPPSADPKIVALEKRLAQARAKLDAAKTAGKPTRNHEDKIYEIEDELRLANQQA
jgi:hypothetical protein